MRWLAAAAALASLAAADPQGARPAPSARAEGDRLLLEAHAEDLFANESVDGGRPVIWLRHRLSGVRCQLSPGAAANRVRVYPSVVRGEDVSCATNSGPDVRTLYVFKAPETTPAALLSRSEREIGVGMQGARALAPATDAPVPLPITGAADPPQPPHLAETMAAGTRAVHVITGKLGPWAVEYRLDGAIGVASRAGMLDLLWAFAVADAAKHGPLPVATGGAAKAVSPAEARAEGDRILAAGQATDLFENVTKGAAIELRHRPSGFTCGFDPGQPENAVVVRMRLPRAEDVACETREADIATTTFLTRLPGVNPTLEVAFAGYVREIAAAHPGAKAAPGPGLSMSMSAKTTAPAPRRMTARFTYEEAGRPVYSRVSVAVVNGWIVEQRITTTPDKANVADLVGELTMLTETAAMAGAATAQGAQVPAAP